MPDFSARSTLPEKMDQPGVPEYETRQALHELEVINNLLGGYSVVLNALEKMEWQAGKGITIMDLGCGGGDMLRVIADWAKKKGGQVNLIGVDMNPVMTDYAADKSKQYPNIRYKTLNIFDDALMAERADIVTCSLFCHHFDDPELVELVKRMYALSSMAVVINDLHRHWFAYHSIAVLTMLFSKTYLVRYDGKLSVARSLTRREWQRVLQEAGLKHYQLNWRWAWRWQVIIPK